MVNSNFLSSASGIVSPACASSLDRTKTVKVQKYTPLLICLQKSISREMSLLDEKDFENMQATNSYIEQDIEDFH